MKWLAMRSFRPPDQQPDRRACNWMLISAALAVGFHVDHLPPWLSGLAACLLLWRYFIENHGWRIPGRAVRWFLLLLTGVLVFRHYGTILGRDAGVAYLALLATLKILEVRSLRDYLLAVFLVYILVLGALLFSQSMATGAYAVVVLFVTTHALIRLNRPDPLPQAQSLRLVVVLMLQALPVLLVLYLLFPRIQGSLWGLPQDAFGGRSGLTEQVAPGTINRMYEDDTVAFRAEFQGPRPAQASLYWRTFVLSDTDGERWQRHRGSGDGAADWRYQPLAPPARYTVALEPHGRRWVPALDLPAAPTGPVRTIPGYALEAHARMRSLTRFELTSYPEYRTGALAGIERRHNRQWPRRPSARVAALIDSWRRQSATPAALVRQGLEYFTDQPFRYTLAPPPIEGDDFLDEFLFETRAGYCEYYASAFAALMRMSGVPARLVVGYLGGEWNETGDYLVVRQSDAHAWTEVWLAETGWVRADPTAAVAPERVELGLDALRRLAAQGAGIGLLPVDQARLLIAPSWGRRVWQDLAWRWDALNTRWDRWVMAYGPQAQQELLKLLGMRAPDWVRMTALMAVLVILVMLAMSAVRMYGRRSSDPVVAAYQRFCNKLKRIGYVRGPAEGPLDFARRLSKARPDLGASVQRITRAYISLRYGQFSAAGLSLLRKQVAAFRAAPAKPPV